MTWVKNIIRPALAVVHGAEVPYPYGGKPRVIMAIWTCRPAGPGTVALRCERGAAASKRHIARGDVKIGDKDYTLAMNNSPDVIETINAFPIKQIDGEPCSCAMWRMYTMDSRCKPIRSR